MKGHKIIIEKAIELGDLIYDNYDRTGGIDLYLVVGFSEDGEKILYVQSDKLVWLFKVSNYGVFLANRAVP